MTTGQSNEDDYLFKHVKNDKCYLLDKGKATTLERPRSDRLVMIARGNRRRGKTKISLPRIIWKDDIN